MSPPRIFAVACSLKPLLESPVHIVNLARKQSRKWIHSRYFTFSGQGATAFPTRHLYSTSEKNTREDNNSDDKPYDPKDDQFFTQEPAFGSKENKGQGEAERPVFHPAEVTDKDETEELSPPTTCCQSGCPNCVWIEYAEKLSKRYTDPGMSKDKVLKELEQLDDQNIKAFIMMELRTRKLI